MHPWIVPLIAGLISAVFLAIGMHQQRRWRLLKDLPTSRPGGVFIGLVEVVGRVRCAGPLVSFLAGQRCVWYAWSVEEHWSRTVTETVRDKDGKSQTRTRHESGWKTVANGGEHLRFDLVDETGSVRIDAQGASITGRVTCSETCGTGDPMYYGKGPSHAVANSDHRRRFHESVIPVDAELFVVGQARQRDDAVAAEITADPAAPLYAISVEGERSVQGSYFWTALACELLGLGAAVAAGVTGLPAMGVMDLTVEYGGPRPNDAAGLVIPGLIGAASYLLIWALVWTWQVFNGLIELRQRVRQGWANIDVQLQRRHDLITRLLPMVQALASHEQQVQTLLAALRTQAQVTPPGRPGPDVAPLAPQLLAVAEAYPALIANRGFAGLHNALVDSEDRIAFARGYFNEIASHWNTRLERIPDRYVAALGRMEPQVQLAAEAGAAVAPRVDLNDKRRVGDSRSAPGPTIER